MKKMFTIAMAGVLMALSLPARSQESNYNNSLTQYGPPAYTGGTVASPSEAYAATARDYSTRGQATNISTIFPNPATSNVSVVLGEIATAPVDLWVVNMNGQVLRAYHFDAGYNRLDIDVSSLSQGLYSIQVQEAGKSMQSIELAKRE